MAVSRGRADLHRVEAVAGVFHPLPARHADVVDAHHRKAAPQRGHGAEEQQAGHGGPEFAAFHARAAQGAQQLGVGPGQFFGVGVCAPALIAVAGDGGRVQVGHCGVGQYGTVEGVLLVAGVQRDQVVVGSFLVGRADAAKGAARQAQPGQEDGLVSGRCLRHVHHDHRLALHALHRNHRPQRAIERAGALAGQVGLQLVGALHAHDGVGVVEQVLRITRHAQQQPAAAHTGLVGESAHGIQDRAIDLAGTLGLDAVRLVHRVQFLQQVFGGAAGEGHERPGCLWSATPC